ncbi:MULTISPECIES: hypothetical protein [Calothrix]|uniref:Uncharacterized protein n=2 Tax=Calothrix TaxID=1186 RepID=A0ABR8A8E1_9CYAN|nr:MULTISPECIES: hypothetical protein [Calothrix]MBD2196138.1 hypothetical protein [Calothrix parietina FACHB-288]MBD2224789.1 hypothetical protein [Calothrix anomala FACHB-343]
MTIKLLLPLLAATLVCGGSLLVEAVQPKPKVTSTPAKTKVNQPVQPKWKLFTGPDGRFSVLMPGTPKRNTQTQKTYMGEINVELFIAQPQKQEVAYVVAYNDFPYSYGQMANPQTVLNNARDIALKTTKSNLISQRDIQSTNGHPGKEIEYVDAGGKFTKNRMYFAQGRLYQVMAVTTKKQRPSLVKTINGYLNSFNLVLKA